MRPPPHAPVTPFDIDQTGITPQMVADKPPAAGVLAQLDALLAPSAPSLLVAHTLPSKRASCTTTASTART
jgi:DNA polymerase-3 subunit epsilon